MFEKLGLNKDLLAMIKKLGFKTPSEIQELSIPHIMKKKDILGESATGSGKTLAFATGVLTETIPNDGIQSLIMAPTRELAEQIAQFFMEVSTLSTVSVYGGVALGPQESALRTAEIVVATPGRLLDHMTRGNIDLSKVKVLVLDEADRMFEMGFIDDIRKIISQCPKKRQTLFFSATLSRDVKELAQDYMIKPVEISAANQVDPSKLHQVYYDTQKNVKFSLLVHMLLEEESGLVMVFCNTRKTVDFVVKNLKSNKIDAIAIHGGLSQNKRSSTLDKFNKGKATVLVCTDVAARGLHIDNVSHVYNYGIPRDSTDYVHRIGRTARAGENGKVINIISDDDYDNFGHVMHDYAFEIKRLETPKVERVVVKLSNYSGERNRGYGGNNRGSNGNRGNNGNRGRR